MASTGLSTVDVNAIVAAVVYVCTRYGLGMVLVRVARYWAWRRGILAASQRIQYAFKTNMGRRTPRPGAPSGIQRVDVGTLDPDRAPVDYFPLAVPALSFRMGSMTETIFAYDATTGNENLLPLDVQAGGYDTGGGIAWTPAQFARHIRPYPAYHYDQDPNAADPTADLLDVEAGAATEWEILDWLRRARACFARNARPGQRWPGLYMSENNVPGAVVILHNAGVVNVPFLVANYNITQSEAVRRVSNATGPYPAIGYQFTDQELGGFADGNIVSVPWLTNVSGQTQEDDVSGQFLSQAYVPFKPGKYSTLYLWRDFETADVRVAVLAGGRFGSVIDYTTSPTKPVTITLPPGAEAVSLVLQNGTGPIGYAFA